MGNDKDMGSTRPDTDWGSTPGDRDRFPDQMPGRYPNSGGGMYPGKIISCGFKVTILTTFNISKVIAIQLHQFPEVAVLTMGLTIVTTLILIHTIEIEIETNMVL
mgnify:CR=1 FL=1